MKEVNEYKINNKLKACQLQFYGFVKTIPETKEEPVKYCFGTPLTKDAVLYVEIIKNGKKYIFNDSNNVKILEGDLLSSYEPFYTGMDSPEVNRIISRYNQRMDDMVESGILVKKLKPTKK